MKHAYYNEHDKYAAAWLRNLISAGLIAPGDVDERSIVEVRADDLRGYTQCHFFAGIGGWSIALRVAGFPDDRSVWTGSCPCQPFSAAGAGKAGDDERHLWPAWFPLIAECKPAIVFGEQVEAAIGWGWLDVVFADLEKEGYACGATVLPACGVGAPHIRQRLWFVADARSERARRDTGDAQRSASEGDSEGHQHRGDLSGSDVPLRAARELADATDIRRNSGPHVGRQRSAYQQERHVWSEPVRCGDNGELADSQGDGWRKERPHDGRLDAGDRAQGRSAGFEPSGVSGTVGHADESGSQGRRLDRNGTDQRFAGSASVAGFWSDAEWIACTDGKARPVGPGSFPLGHGIQRRASKLRAYGNAIVPACAAEFIKAAKEAIAP